MRAAMKRINRLKQWAKQIKRDVYAVWFAARDPETPFIAKLLALLVAAYAISPIDLIPDFYTCLGLFGWSDFSAIWHYVGIAFSTCRGNAALSFTGRCDQPNTEQLYRSIGVYWVEGIIGLSRIFLSLSFKYIDILSLLLADDENINDRPNL